MKKHFGLTLVIFLAVLSTLGFSCEKMVCSLKPDLDFCPSALKDADTQFLAGNYENAISLYQAYLAGNPSVDKIGLVKNKISDCYYNLGEKAFNLGNWSDALNYYTQSQNMNAPNRISKCYFNLGEEYFTKGDYQMAIEYYNKSKEPGVQARIQSAQDALQAGETVTPEPAPAPQTVYITQPGTSGKSNKKDGGEEFLIKVATNTGLQEANNMVNAIRRQGITAYNTKQPGKSNVVFAGPFNSRDKAQVALAKIHALGKGYKRAFIVKK